jgi:DNA repair exonuclease SbcCD ATPase subunit
MSTPDLAPMSDSERIARLEALLAGRDAAKTRLPEPPPPKQATKALTDRATQNRLARVAAEQADREKAEADATKNARALSKQWRQLDKVLAEINALIERRDEQYRQFEADHARLVAKRRELDNTELATYRALVERGDLKRAAA